MPLIKRASKKAFADNVAAEMNAGKPQDQSLAIAYNIKRKASKKKMAQGGVIAPEDRAVPQNRHVASSELSKVQTAFNDLVRNNDTTEYWADGGEVGSMADEIRRRKKAKMMAEGGMVDIQENGEEEPDQQTYDRQNLLAAKKELYDDEQLEDQPLDSNEHGDDIESDLHDMVSAIRRKMKSRA